MNELQRKVAELSAADQSRLLSWLALSHPLAVEEGLKRPAARLDSPLITYRLNQPEEEDPQ